jgi:hypothetical protein
MFIFVGLPLQFICYPIYLVLLVPYYLFFAIGRQQGVDPEKPTQTISHEELYKRAMNDKLKPGLEGPFIANEDDHCLLVHGYTYLARPDLSASLALSLMVDTVNKTLRRRFPRNSDTPVSGDCLASWVATAARLYAKKNVLPRSLIKILTDSYLKNCLGLPAWRLDYKVSSRSSNSGVNLVPDGWKGLCQPALGPQYFNTAALLLLSAKTVSRLYYIPYFLHFWLMGGPLWILFPLVHPHHRALYDSQHVTLLSVYAIAKLSKNPIYGWTMRWLARTMSPNGFHHPLFICWLADAGFATKDEKQAAYRICQSFQHFWPQYWPGRADWYEIERDRETYSVVAGAAKMLEESWEV